MKINTNAIDRGIQERALEYVPKKYHIDKNENYVVIKFDFKSGKIIVDFKKYEEPLFIIKRNINAFISNNC